MTIKTKTKDYGALEAIHTQLSHWRQNKTQYPGAGIPDKIWLEIFQKVDQGFKKSELCRHLGLNSPQYDKKIDQLIEKPKKQTSKEKEKQQSNLPQEDVEFAEVMQTIGTAQDVIPPLQESASKTKQTIKKLRSNDTSIDSVISHDTVVVECYRPDGFRLQIHTIKANVNEIISSFCQTECSL